MKRSHDDDPSAARAIERVLQAERDGSLRIERARREAAVALEQARSDGLALVNRALERGARWQQAHAALLERRLQALRDDNAASTPALPAESSLTAAAARVAAELVDAETHDDGAR